MGVEIDMTKEIKETKKKVWIVLDDKKRPESVWFSKEDAEYEAKDVCFMGSCGESQPIIKGELVFKIK